MPPQNERVTAQTLRRWGLPDAGGSKYDRGSVLVAGGARRTPGAVMLAGVAALRVGAGRLVLGVADSIASAVAVAVPEAGVVPLPETTGSVARDAHAALLPELKNVRALLFGSGLDDVDTAREIVAQLVPAAPDSLTVVLDAFALGAIARHADLVRALRGRLVLTPNPAEIGILLDGAVDPDRPDEFRAAAQEVALQYGAICATQSLVTAPDGTALSLEIGGPGLGTSGSGDVLAGAVAGFAARGVPPLRAAVWGTYVHAAAGDDLARDTEGIGYLARELSARFPTVIARTLA